MVVSIWLLFLLIHASAAWTSAIRENPALPHQFDLQISSHTSRAEFQAATRELASLKNELDTLNNSVVFSPGMSILLSEITVFPLFLLPYLQVLLNSDSEISIISLCSTTPNRKSI